MERDQIHLDLAAAMQEERLADEAFVPFASGCAAADAQLLWLIQQHGPGPRTDVEIRDIILAAYEARRIAHHQAWPHRQRLKRAEDWVAALRKRLRELKLEDDAP